MVSNRVVIIILVIFYTVPCYLILRQSKLDVLDKIKEYKYKRIDLHGFCLYILNF